MAKYETQEQTLRRLEREERAESTLNKVELKAAKNLLATAQRHNEYLGDDRECVELLTVLIDRIIKKQDGSIKTYVSGDKQTFVYGTKLSGLPYDLQAVARGLAINDHFVNFYYTETANLDDFSYSRIGVENLTIRYLKQAFERKDFYQVTVMYPTVNDQKGCKYRPSHKALVHRIFAMISDDNILVDDGSNDDDFDEDELVTVDSTDNDDDDDDELVDEPIETEEVQEEVKMLKVSKEKLAAYEKATNAENNRVTVYLDGNRKQFEVYGTYYVKRKVNCARGVKVYKDVEMVDWHKVSQKDVAEILKNYGLTIDEFVDIANGDYEEETAEVIAEVTEENVTTNEEVTAENNAEVENNIEENAIEEIAEVENVTNEEVTATEENLMALSAEIKLREENMQIGVSRIATAQEKILYYVNKILEVEDTISDLTALILNDRLICEKLQAKIANLKLIDVTDEIATADALDASVAAMVELNAANDFTANLLDAVNAQVGTAIENVVTFELQNFAEDEDAEIEKQFAEFTELARREKELEQKIAALKEELHAVRAEYSRQDWTLTKRVKNLMDEAYKTVKTAFEKRTEFGYIQINGITMTSWHWDEYNAVRTKFDESGFALWFYDDTAPREYQLTEIVKYSTVKQFKAAIRGLVAAIKRGDEEFTFPADETAGK